MHHDFQLIFYLSYRKYTVLRMVRKKVIKVVTTTKTTLKGASIIFIGKIYIAVHIIFSSLMLKP